MTRIGIIGTGFIAQGIARIIQATHDLTLSTFLSRRPLKECLGTKVTNSKEELADQVDLVIECTGDPIFGTEALEIVSDRQIPILTMDCELQTVTGSYFAKKGYISECDGDQPGCFARLKQEIEPMGFRPLAYVNIKGFLNENPSEKDMEYWSKKQGVRVEQTTSFTDGTKLQIEQVLVANGLGATIAKEGLIGGDLANLKETDYLGDQAKKLGVPISDYIVSPQSPPGVFIVAENPIAEFYKGFGPISSMTTSQGRYQTLVKPYHLCHFEVIHSIRDALSGKKPLLNNSTHPRFSVAAVAKRPLSQGLHIQKATGSFDFRGKAIKIKDHTKHVPIGLLVNARLKQNIEAGQLITFEDVELPSSRALEIYQKILETTLNGV